MPASARSRLSLLCACAVLAGCSTMHVKRATYQVLRQEDCRLNQLESFCRRNFANEYHEYDRLRRNYMRESSEDTWRTSRRDAAVDALVADSGAAAASPLAVAPALRTVSGSPASRVGRAFGAPFAAAPDALTDRASVR